MASFASEKKTIFKKFSGFIKCVFEVQSSLEYNQNEMIEMNEILIRRTSTIQLVLFQRQFGVSNTVVLLVFRVYGNLQMQLLIAFTSCITLTFLFAVPWKIQIVKEFSSFWTEKNGDFQVVKPSNRFRRTGC